MDAARFNVYWFAWLLTPAVLMATFTYRHTRRMLLLGVVLSLASTFALSNLAVSEKWNIRNEIARTAEEVAYATADGANLVFTLFVFAPLEAIFFTSLWGLLGWHFWARARRMRQAAVR